jgi:hypothetical protein
VTEKKESGERPAEERRRRFSWEDDDVLHLQIEGKDIRSTPPPKSDT